MKNIFKHNLVQILFFCIVPCTTNLFSQNEASKWYFGYQAALDFMTSPPTSLNSSSMVPPVSYNYNEGTASMADSAGNLLFYTDGVTVWNKNNVVMANGSGLLGHCSSSQSALAVKSVSNPQVYFLFTLDEYGRPNGLRYSLIDMTLAAGMGSVTVKNVPIYSPATEKLCGVRHCNGKDIWIVSHEIPSSNFRAYLLTSAGLNMNPIISSAGTVLDSTNSQGCMKISPNGKKIGMANYSFSIPSFQLFDFDNFSGIVSNPLLIPLVVQGYGCEFSADGTKFYGSLWTTGNTAGNLNVGIYQWNLCAGSATAIVASQYSIATLASSAMQLGPDGKIYTTRPFYTALGVINNPNLQGAACYYVDQGAALSTGTCITGLPALMIRQPAFAPFAFVHNIACNTVSFTSYAPVQGNIVSGCSFVSSPYASISWVFGDPASGASNTSTLTHPTHVYSSAGHYTVELISYSPCSIDTVRSAITITDIPPVLAVAGVFTLCKGTSITYTVSGASSYTWTNGTHAATISLSPSVTTVYSVSATGTNTGCNASTAFTVDINPCTSIQAASSEDTALKIFPNPCQGILTLETKYHISVHLINSLGDPLYTGFFEPGVHTISIGHLPGGVYILRSFNSRLTNTTRLIKIE